MNLTSLEFGAFLSYSPQMNENFLQRNMEEIQNAKTMMYYLKSDSFLNNPPILMSEWVAQMIKKQISTLPFNSFFHSNTILIPTPSSSLMRPHTLWVPDRLATALVNNGLGKEVVRCLKRNVAVRKAAFCAPQDRPTAEQHYETIRVDGVLSASDEIVLIDDIITRGATLIGAANRLLDVFPTARVCAFAAMRTISDSSDFHHLIEPCKGEITLRPSGDTIRRP